MAESSLPFVRTQAARSVLSRGVPAVSLNLGAATAAVAAPVLDVRAAGAAGQGLAQLGQGLGAAGDMLGKLAQKQAEHINERHILEAEAAMDEVRGKIAARWINEPDETKWEGIAAEELSAAEGSILHESLSPDAREAISTRMVRWNARTIGEAKVNSARRSREKLTEQLGARAMQFEAAGNAEGAAAVYTHMEKEGLLAADRAEALRQQAAKAAEVKQKEAAWNQEYAAIQADPEAYLAENAGLRPNESPEEHAQRVGAARQTARMRFLEQSQEVENLLVKPGVTAAEIEAATSGMQPAEAARWKESFVRLQDSAAKAEAMKPENINALWAKLDEAVDGFDRDAPDARAQYTAIRGTALAGLPEGWRQHILSRLDGKWSGEPPDLPTALRDEMLSAIDGAYDEGQFGPVTMAVTEGKDKAADRWEVAIPGKTYEATRVTAKPLPEEKLKAARARKAGLKLRMLEAMKAHPEWAGDPAAAFSYLDGLKSGVRRESAPALRFGGGGIPEVEPSAGARPLPSLRQRPAPADSRGASEWIDSNLPDVPGPPGSGSSLLFPDEPPPVE